MKKWNSAVMSIVAATLLAASPAWAVQASAKSADSSAAQAQGAAQQTIAKLEKLLPYMEQLPVEKVSLDEDSAVIVVERRKLEEDKEAAMTIYLNKQTGSIQSFEYAADDAGDEELSPDEQKKKADVFLRELLGDVAEGYQFDAKRSEELGTPSYQLVVNGIPFFERNLLVSVNGNGEVSGLMANAASNPLSSANLPKKEEAISVAQAEKAIAERMTPAYRLQKDGKSMMLTYHVSWSGMLDAKTGQSVETQHSQFYYEPDLSGALLPVSSQGKTLTAKDKAEAAALLKTIIGFNTEDATYVERAAEDTPEGKVQNYVWKKGTFVANVSVKAATGQVIDVSLEPSQYVEPKQKVTVEAARKAAVQVLQVYLDKETKAVALDASSYLKDPNAYRFTFYRTQNGLPVLNHAYQVTIDKETGKVIGLFGEFSKPANVAYPDPANIVPREQAAKEYLKHHPLSLVYLEPVLDGKRQPNPLLVYKSAKSESVQEYVDAVTGSSIPRK
ncbi:YcdB/YcdC domain-containing protein [Brevibacillus parabrevis]|uniref:YcdB/YcdC domain-containing protein n=1 Tax=Brevibacillus parabrevis TaxID=54914 RepID=UPI001F609F5F|nr:YcdB/YcdC domain-containing protein [Brevibacillus parabrevis]